MSFSPGSDGVYDMANVSTDVMRANVAAWQDWIERVAHEPVDGRPDKPDVCVIELGGTVGDIESMPFIEVGFLSVDPGMPACQRGRSVLLRGHSPLD
jgi:CTP synthase N-terminus